MKRKRNELRWRPTGILYGYQPRKLRFLLRRKSVINSINHERVLVGCLMDNIHEMPKQHSQKIPQTTYTKLPPNSFKDSNGLIEGLLGDVSCY